MERFSNATASKIINSVITGKGENRPYLLFLRETSVITNSKERLAEKQSSLICIK